MLLIKREGKSYAIYHGYDVVACFALLDEAIIFVDEQGERYVSEEQDNEDNIDNVRDLRKLFKPSIKGDSYGATAEQRLSDSWLGPAYRTAGAGPAIEHTVIARVRVGSR